MITNQKNLDDFFCAFDTDFEKPFIIGLGNALFLKGWCYHATERIKKLFVLVNEMSYPVTNFSIMRPDILQAHFNVYDFTGNSLQSGFWLIVPLQKEWEGEANILLRAEVGSGEVFESATFTLTLKSVFEKGSEEYARTSDAPLVAICMATYNPPIDLFKRQIDSIIEQTYGSWVCIINDDCSDPEVFREIVDITHKDARFRICRNTSTLGFYHNFEACLAKVPKNASFVALSDQDDNWHKEKLSVMLAHFDDDTNLVYSDMNIVNEKGELLHSTYWVDRKNNFNDLELQILVNTITGAASSFRKSLLDLILPFPTRVGDMYHDHFIGAMAMAVGKVKYIDKALYDYCQHSGNVIGHKGRSYDLDWKTYYSNLYFFHYPRRVLISNVIKLRCPNLSPDKRAVIDAYIRWETSVLGILFQVIKNKLLLKGSIVRGFDTTLLKGVLVISLMKYFRVKK